MVSASTEAKRSTRLLSASATKTLPEVGSTVTAWGSSTRFGKWSHLWSKSQAGRAPARRARRCCRTSGRGCCNKSAAHKTLAPGSKNTRVGAFSEKAEMPPVLAVQVVKFACPSTCWALAPFSRPAAPSKTRIRLLLSETYSRPEGSPLDAAWDGHPIRGAVSTVMEEVDLP